MFRQLTRACSNVVSSILTTTQTQSAPSIKSSLYNGNFLTRNQPDASVLATQARGIKMMPKSTRSTKAFKGRVNLKPCNQFIVNGDFGIIAAEPGRIKAKTIQVVYDLAQKETKSFGGKLWMRMFPHIQVTAKPADVRRGRGKGDVDHWMCRCRKNKVLIEFKGLPYESALKLFKRIRTRINFKTKLMPKEPEVTAKQFISEIPHVSPLEERMIVKLSEMAKRPLIDLTNRL